MSVGLAWRLVWSGVASEEDVESALHQQLLGRQPFLRALLLHSPEVSRVLENELAGADTELAVDSELAIRLPDGAAATFLAIPIGRDPDTGVVLVAAADPLDRHVAREFEFHLGEPVSLVPVALDRLLAALPAPTREEPVHRPEVVPPRAVREAPRAAADARLGRGPSTPVRSGTPAHGTPVVQALSSSAPSVALRPSERPIPLVRVNPSAIPVMRTVSVGPSSGDQGAYTDEPVLSLTRPKPASSPVAAPPPAKPTASFDVASALDALRSAQNADEVVSLLVRATAPLARSVVAFGLRGNAYVGRDAAGQLDMARVRALQIALDRPSILKTASELGHYLGPVPATDAHGELLALLPGGEISAHAVPVGGRVPILLVLAGISNAYAATGVTEQLVRAASKALEALVRARKR